MGLIGTFLKLLGIIFLVIIIVNALLIAKTGESPIKISMPSGSDKEETDADEGGGDKLLEFVNKFKRNVYITSN